MPPLRLSLSLKLSPLMLTMIEWWRSPVQHRNGEHAVAGKALLLGIRTETLSSLRIGRWSKLLE